MLSHTLKNFHKEKETSVYGKECEAIFGQHRALTTRDCSRASGYGPELPVEVFFFVFCACVCVYVCVSSVSTDTNVSYL